MTHDSDFDSLVEEFNEKKKHIDIVTHDVTSLLGSLDGIISAEQKLADDMKELFPSLCDTARLCDAQSATVRDMSDTKDNTLDPLVQEYFNEPIKTYLVQFREVSVGLFDIAHLFRIELEKDKEEELTWIN